MMRYRCSDEFDTFYTVGAHVLFNTRHYVAYTGTHKRVPNHASIKDDDV